MSEVNLGTLVNLDSPEKGDLNEGQSKLKSPLIPCPKLDANSSEGNNPFDEAAIHAENWDPFELVLKESLTQSKKQPLDDNTNIVNRGGPRLARSQSVTENVSFYFQNRQESTENSLSNDKVLDISTHSLDEAFIVRNEIRRVIQRRVSDFIERSLNTSRAESLNGDISIIQDRCINDETITLRNHLTSTSLLNTSVRKESVYNELPEVCEEAKNLSHLFRSLSFPSCRDKKERHMKREEEEEEEEEDLMFVTPPWEEDCDDVEEESSKESELLGLPKLNLFYVKNKNRKYKDQDIDSVQLAHYKKRIRASLDGNMSEDEPMEEMSKPQKSQQKEPIEQLAATAIKSVAAPPEVSELRPKKKDALLKKGPLKAMVPLQKMTKNLVQKMSPLKKGSTLNSLNLLNRVKGKSNQQDSSFSSSLVHPVASSTPNKSKDSQRLKQKGNIGTPLSTKPNSARSRLDKKDTEKPSPGRRSSSLSAVFRKPSSKQPFTAVNKIEEKKQDNKPGKRPHTAPNPDTKSSNLNKGSPKVKKNANVFSKIRLYNTAASDKENRVLTF